MSELDFRELQELAAEILGVEPEQVQLKVSFARDLAADSLDLVELIAAVEDKYDVELPEEELEQMKNVGDLWKFFEEKTAERASVARWPSPRHPVFAPTRYRCGRTARQGARRRLPASASTCRRRF